MKQPMTVLITHSYVLILLRLQKIVNYLFYLLKHNTNCANLTDVCQYPMSLDCCAGEPLYFFLTFPNSQQLKHTVGLPTI
jgi:hypothetical protein